MSERIWFLKRCHLFDGLTPEQADRLERRSRLRRFGKGQIIYFPSDAAETVLVVAEGRVVIKDINPEGKEVILAFVEPGEVFGELAVLEQLARNEYAQALDGVQILALPRDELLWLIEQRADVGLRITRLVALRRRRIENRLCSVLFHSIRDRVTRLLLELLESYGERNDQGWEIRLRLSHQELASLIGATRETVTGVLGHLQLERLVRVRRRHITVLDRDGLAAQVGEMLVSADREASPQAWRPQRVALAASH